jgi:predicted amidohydrolase
MGAFAAAASPGRAVPPPEATVFQPGGRDPLVRFGSAAAAVAICADTGRPAHARAAAERGADTYLASVFAAPIDFAKDVANLEACAARHALAVVFANFGAPSGGVPSAGRSAIWSPRGERLVQLEPSGAGVAVASESGGGWRARAIMLDGRPPRA